MIRFVDLRGPESESFLHRVTAGKVKSLPVGSGRRGLFLSGQSRVVAQFDLLREAADHFRLAVPEECATALAEGLEALHLSEDLTITLQPEERAGLRYLDSAGDATEEYLVRRGSWPSAVPGWQNTSARR